MSKESSSLGKEARLLVKWTVVSLASSGDSESEGGLTPPPLKRARLSAQRQTGEPSSDQSASVSSLSASGAHPSASTNSSGSMSGPSRLSSNKPDPQQQQQQRQQQTNGVTLENITNDGVAAINGERGLVNGVGTGVEDGEIATERLEQHISRVRKRPQRQLTGIDADIVRLIGQHLREMGFK